MKLDTTEDDNMHFSTNKKCVFFNIFKSLFNILPVFPGTVINKRKV